MAKKGVSVGGPDLVDNYILLRTVLKLYPLTVPSCYLFADALVYYDNVTNHLLFPGLSKPLLERRALKEGQAFKMMVSYLRLLYPNSGTSSKWPEIEELKDCGCIEVGNHSR